MMHWAYDSEKRQKVAEKISKSCKGRIPWNKGKTGLQVAWNRGLNKENDKRVAQIGEKVSKKRRMSKNTVVRETLSELYLEEGLSTHIIGKRINRSSGYVYAKMREFGIPTRPKIKNAKELTCPNCGEKFIRRPSEIHGQTVYCSRECYFEHRKHLTGENNPNWKGGYELYYGPNWRKQRRKALKRDGYKCRLCSNSEQLNVHHIIPFRKFDDYLEANQLSNLITLCDGCHKKVEQKPEVCLSVLQR